MTEHDEKEFMMGKTMVILLMILFLAAPLSGSEWTHWIEDYMPIEGWFPEQPPEGPASMLGNILDDAAVLLGLTLKDAYAALGIPGSVYPLRGHDQWQDDVVFSYADGLSIFFFRDRVWQVRIEKMNGIEGTGPSGIFILSSEDLIALIGNPYAVIGRSFIYLLSDRGFPVRVRLFFDDNGVHDMYVYRGDF